MNATQRRMSRWTIFTALVAVLIFTAGHLQRAQAMQPGELFNGPFNRAKYVFLFIGDGMAMVQVNAAEVFMASVKEPDQVMHEKLNMSTLPVQGACTTFDQYTFITDSASAGTALACGKKTKSGVVAMDADGKIAYTSIAKLARAKGMKVGIVSSVSIDHATPAVFYANEKSRNDYYDISLQLAQSDFNYFAGGGFKQPRGKNGDQPSSIDLAIANGFRVVSDRDEFFSLVRSDPANEKVIVYNPVLDDDQALYYDLDTQADPLDHITLAQFTRKGIELLDNNFGFFMMVEGGKIDWACHANDARAAIDDVRAFDDAVAEALAFYQKHPNETLIVVTADHETGGMTIGWAGTQYATFFHELSAQTISYLEFNKVFAPFKSNPTADIEQPLKDLVFQCFGIDYGSLKPYQKQELENAYDRSTGASPSADPDKDYLLYGGYDPFTVTLTHILNNNAGIGWTSYSHTGVPVPVFALGKLQDLFGSFYDNTDIAYKLADAMKVPLSN